jgi:hypothetical protein
MKRLFAFSLVFFTNVHSSDNGSIFERSSVVSSSETVRLEELNLMAELLNLTFNKFTEEQKSEINFPLFYLGNSEVVTYRKELIKCLYWRSQARIDQRCYDPKLIKIFKEQVSAMEIIDHRCSDSDWKERSLEERADYNIRKNKAYASAYALGCEFEIQYLNSIKS